MAICLGLVGSASANQTVQLGSSSTGLKLLDQNQMGLTLQIDIGEINLNPISTREGSFALLSIEGCARSQNIGEPNLPMFNRLLKIPFGSEISVNIIDSQYEDISLSQLGINAPIMPAQPSLSKSQNPDEVPFEYNQETYRQAGYYALPIVSSEVVGTMRWVHMGRVLIAPVQYNPTENTLRIYKHLVVQVSYAHPDFGLTNKMIERYYSPVFEPVFSRLINFDRPSSDMRHNLTKYPIKYVIISHRMFEAQLQPFIAWKQKKGFNVIVAYTDVIGYTNTAIKNYIQTLYNNSNPPEDPAPSFVLFVGDTPQIPPFNGVAGSHITDLNFCEYTNDFMPEIYYGRFSAQNTGELQPQIDKTLEYDRYLMPDPGYLSEVTLIAGVDSYYAPTYGNGQINYGTNLYFNLAHGVVDHTWLYPASDDPGAAAAIRQTVNDGIGFINYTAHGSHSGWADPSFTVTDINNLTNAHKYSLSVGNCCLTNTFGESTPCFGEAWLQAANKGGVGYIGASNSTYWDEDYWWGVGFGPIVPGGPDYYQTTQGAYDGTFHDHGEAVVHHYVTNDAMIFAGNVAVTESGSGMYDYYWEAYHLMGDPSLMTYMGVPSANNINHDGVIPIVATYFTISADPGSYIGISKDGILHGAAYVDSSGVVDVPLIPFDEPGFADIVITAQFRIPYDITIPIIANGYGAISGRVTDLVTANGLAGTVTVTNRVPPIVSHCNSQGYYIMHVPADTMWDLRAEYTSDYLPSFAQVSVLEDDTVTQDFALEPKVPVVLKASFGNPADIAYRTFYFRGSWNDDGFYDAGWNCSFSPMRDDGVAPDQIAGDGVFSGSILLAADLVNAYGWAVFSENYGGNAGALQLGSSFQITNPGVPPTVPVLVVNPSGSEHNWTLTLSDISGNEIDFSPGYYGQPNVWYVTIPIPAGYTLQFYVKAMHSNVSTYGEGGLGGPRIVFTPPVGGNYTIYFDDNTDVASAGASMLATPSWFDVEITPGGTTTRQMVLKNEGGLDVNFSIPDDFGDKGAIGNIVLPETPPFAVYEGNDAKSASVPEEPNPPIVMGQGGPDLYGYKWIDSDEPGGPTFQWVDITTIGTPITMSDDTNTGPYTLPFVFNYYGVNYNSIRVCSNGWISFNSSSTSYSNTNIPSPSAPTNMLGAMWDDLNPGAAGTVYRYITADTAIIAWVNVPHYSNSGSYTFEIIITSGGAITFQYQTMTGDLLSATVGIQNANGTDGLQVAYNAAYIHNNLAARFSAGWLEVDPLTGVIPAGGQVPLTLSFDAGALTVGDYAAAITINAWDAIHTLPTMTIPVNLHVVGSLPSIDLSMHPDQIPTQVPRGGSFDYDISVTNTTGGALIYDGWLMLNVPGYGMYGPLAQVNNLNIPAGATRFYQLDQAVPGFAPLGIYTYYSYVGDYPSTVVDDASFPFEVITGGLARGADSWTVTGFTEPLSGESVENPLPKEYALLQNYPNPFNAQSIINYALPSEGRVELTVFNLLGQKVATLIDGHQEAGYHSITWDASHNSSGIYFYKLNAGGHQFVKRMMLIK